ncbi:hypothetical protein BN1723_017321, partial [Verticillium longisporum]
KPNQWTSIGKINPDWSTITGDMVRMADVDNDGRADLIVSYSDGAAKVWKNTDNLKLDLKPTGLTFDGHSDTLKKDFHLDLELYGEIDTEESKVNHTGKNIELKLQKKELKEEYWPRLLKESKKVHFLKTNFDKWVDEDEQEEAPEEDFSQFGGMGGMPGMGGMEGMGGMPGMGGMGGMPGMGGGDFGGIDFSKLGAGGLGGADFDGDDDDE